jgi:hypothetical protein
MRRSALAAAVMCAGLFAGGVAAAERWTDPAGRLTFDAPRGWQVQPQQNSNATIVMTFDGSHDCYLFSTPNLSTSGATAERVRSAGVAQLPTDSWTRLANGVSSLFPGRNAAVTSQSVDASGAWPIQRAELSGGESPVYGAFQARPGADIVAFCVAYGSDIAVFEELFRSIGHPNDASWGGAAPALAPTP